MEVTNKFRPGDLIADEREMPISKVLLRNRRRCALLAAALLILPSLLKAQSSEREKPPPFARIHFGDVVDVDVVGSLEFDWRGSLNPEGFLDGMDRVEEPVFALCRSEREVAASITQQYRRILRDPEVVVRIIDRSNRALAYVTGAVTTPHRFQIARPVSLAELIVLSGGITDASNGEINIFRPPNVNCLPEGPQPLVRDASLRNAGTRISIKIADLLTGDPSANVPVVSGDIVTVTEAPPVFVAGDVISPRRMNLTPDLTLSRAVATAGGASRSYKGQKARIHRRGSAAGPLEYDLGDILGKKIEDPKLQPYDVVEVDQKGVQPRKVAASAEAGTTGPDRLAMLPLKIVD